MRERSSTTKGRFERLPFAFLAIVFSTTAFSPIAQADNLLGLVDKAKSNDPAFLAASHKRSADREVFKQARARMLPTISYQYEDKDTDQTIVSADNTVFAQGSETFGTTSEGFTLNQPLFDYEIWARFKQSRSTQSRADADFQLAEQELLMRASEAYFLALEKADQLATVQDEKDALQGHLKLAKKKNQAGLGRLVDVDGAEARYLEAVAKEIELQSRFIDSRYAIAELTGALPGDLNTLSQAMAFQSPEPANADVWVDLARTTNPQILSREYALEEASQEVKAQRGGHYPTVDLTYTDGSEETGGSLFGGGSEVETNELVLRVNVPIFQGLGVRSKVKQAVENQFRAEDELRREQRENEREVRDAFQRINASIVQAKALAQSVAAQKRLLKLKTNGYSSGRYNILEVLDAQKDLSSVSQAYTKSRYDYVLNTLRLKFAAGNLAYGDIERIDSWLLQ
jgi:outer membrane protein